MKAHKLLTLMLLTRNNNQVLLGMKKKGFGVGKINGFGGKVEPGEQIAAAAVREMKEEAGVDVLGARHRGTLLFEFEDDPVKLEVHVFRADQYEGVPTESDEMSVGWYNYDDIPYDTMWKDDRFWVPFALKDLCFRGYFLFRGHDVLVRYTLQQCEPADLERGPLLE